RPPSRFSTWRLNQLPPEARRSAATAPADRAPSPRDGIASEGAERRSEAVLGGGPHRDSFPMGGGSLERPSDELKRPAGAQRRLRPTGAPAPRDGIASEGAERRSEAVLGRGPHRDSFPMGGGSLERPSDQLKRPAGAQRRRRPTGPRRFATGSRAEARSAVAKGGSLQSLCKDPPASITTGTRR